MSPRGGIAKPPWVELTVHGFLCQPAPNHLVPHGEEARSAVSNHVAPLVPFILRDARRRAPQDEVWQLVGWVERSETHRLAAMERSDGFRCALPILREGACATPGSVLAFPIGDEAGSPSDGPPSKLCAHSTCRGWRMDVGMTDIATEPKPSTSNALIRLLYVARGLRGFGDGFAVIILPAYLTALGYDAIAVGIVATASLLGTALLTLITGWIAPRHDLRALLIAGACLMAATGIAFPGVEHFVLIALVAFVGTINPSGGDLGVLVPLEHAVLAHSATDERRTQVFARYSLIGALCTAVGSLAASLPDLLVAGGSTQLAAFRLMFYAYATIGIG